MSKSVITPINKKILDETNPFETDKCKSENWASKSDKSALFYCSSGRYIRITMPSK